MKTISRVLNVAIVLTLCGVVVLGVDLRNEDSTRYEVKIHDGASTLNTSIDGNSTQANVCSSCTIEVVGVGSIKVSGSTRVVIKDGKLTRE
jgi:hypothetical protein